MKKQILIFDDDIDILSILSYVLEEKGWEIHTRTDCENIIAVVKEINPDVILMDNWIPKTGGVASTQTLKHHDDTKHIPVVFFTANNAVEDLSHEAGADTFIAKPFNLDDLEEVIEQFLDKKPAIPASPATG